MEECEKWIGYETYFDSAEKKFMFKIKNDANQLVTYCDVIDLNKKCFQHNIERITQNLDKLLKNYPKLKSIYENLNIYMNPKPTLGSSNAEASTNHIIYHARGTQIPHCMTDYITAHEIGHIVQFNFCKIYGDNKKFREYLELRNAPRGICKDVFSNEDNEPPYVDKEDFLFLSGTQEEKTPDWDLSPQEWFAEDFRYFFGCDTGEEYWGLPIPKPTEEIREFMLSL